MNLSKAEKFNVNFKTTYNSKEMDTLYVKMTISSDLRKLLKQATISGTQDVALEGNDQKKRTFKRYKVKKWAFNPLVHNYRTYLFFKDLIDKKEIIFPFNAVRDIDNLIKSTRENIKILIQIMHQYNNLDVSIDFTTRLNEEPKDTKKTNVK